MRSPLALNQSQRLEAGLLPTRAIRSTQPVRDGRMRVLNSEQLTQVSGGISAVAGIDVLAGVLKTVQGGGSVRPKK